MEMFFNFSVFVKSFRRAIISCFVLQLTPEQAEELGIDVRLGKNKPSLEEEYEVS